MKKSKRHFLKTLVAGSLFPFFSKANTLTDFLPEANLEKSPNDFWLRVRNEYELPKQFINLENGYYSMCAKPVLQSYLNDIRMVNTEASHYMRTVQFSNKKKVLVKLAQFLGCSEEELIITRNTTESLDTIISGYPWQKGDEAIMAEQDYGSMLDMFSQVAKRHQIVCKKISIPLNPQSDEEIVSLYENAITANTKLIMVCHMINITGQILPIQKITEMAHKKGVEVMVDGAHAIAHFQFNINELDCDYYGSSLHKWLGCPIGAGILYVKKKHIEKIWPLFGESGFPANSIQKLNHTGTHPVATDLAISHAIDFHQYIGSKRKEERLRFLQNYWISKVRGVGNVRINTPDDPIRSCGIANVGIDGYTPQELAKILMDKYKIWTVAIDTANVHGVRITPHVYTTTEELNQFIKAIIELALQTKK